MTALFYCNKNLWIQITFTETAAGHQAALFDSYSKPVITTNIKTHAPFYSFIPHKHTGVTHTYRTVALTNNQAFDQLPIVCYSAVLKTDYLSPTKINSLEENKEMRTE